MGDGDPWLVLSWIPLEGREGKVTQPPSLLVKVCRHKPQVNGWISGEGVVQLLGCWLFRSKGSLFFHSTNTFFPCSSGGFHRRTRPIPVRSGLHSGGHHMGGHLGKRLCCAGLECSLSQSPSTGIAPMQSRFRKRETSPWHCGMVRSASANKLEFGPELLVEPCKLHELAQIKGQ